MEKKILVTGGAGYIGSHTVVELIAQGYTPIIVDDFRNSEQETIARIESLSNSKLIFFPVDICDRSALLDIAKQHNIEGVIHFAADKSVGESVENPLKYYENNINGLLSVLHVCGELNISNFVFSSSCTVYGIPKESYKVDEETPLGNPSSPYGQTKKMCEQIICDYYNSGAKLKSVNLRYFNPVGAHPSGLIGELPIGEPNNLLPYITQAGTGVLEKLTVFGNDYGTQDGTCLRDYIHVVDLAKAHVKSLEWLSEKQEPLVEVFNLGTGEGTSVLEIIHTFEEVSNKKLNWEFGPRRSGDVEAIFADATKANEVLGWKSELTIVDAVRDAWNWEKKLRSEV